MIYEKEIPTTIKVVDKLVCDCCGAVSPQKGRNEWSDENFRSKEVTISYENRLCYPECCGDTKIIKADICPDCFENKVRPALEAVGVKFQVIEYDF